MRVIAGQAGGKTLRLDRRAGVRPTSDRLKEAMFSTLAGQVPGSRVLDLFAGSGSLAIEALSRGAERATLVDSSRSSIDMIVANLAATGLSGRARVLHVAAETFAGSPFEDDNFDLLLMDPPYSYGFPARVLHDLLAAGRVRKGALVVVEVSSRCPPFEIPAGYRLTSRRKYSDSTLVYLMAQEGG